MINSTTHTDPVAWIAGTIAAVEALERCPLGEPYADRLGAASDAVARLRHLATDAIFPHGLTPVTAAALADLSFCCDEQSCPRLDFPSALAAVHARALDGHPELAALIRSPRARWRLIATLEASMGGISAEHLSAALDGFEQTIARQLAGRGELMPWSAALASTLPDVDRRISSAHDAHRTHAEASVAAMAATAAEMDRVLDEANRAHRASLAARARALRLVHIPGDIEVTAGHVLASKIESASEAQLRRFEAGIVAAEAAGAFMRQSEVSS